MGFRSILFIFLLSTTLLLGTTGPAQAQIEPLNLRDLAGAVIVEIETGELGYIRETDQFTYHGKPIDDYREIFPMDKLREMANAVNADPQKRLYVEVTFNLDSWRGRLPQENFSQTGGAGASRIFIADEAVGSQAADRGVHRLQAVG